MKKIITAAVLLLPLSLIAQEIPFEIKGKIADPGTPAKVFVYYRNGADNISDSTDLQGGQFSFKGKVASPSRATLVLRKAMKMENLSLYLEKGVINVNGSEGFSTATISGGPLNAEFNKLGEATKATKAKYAELNKEYMAADEATRKSEAFLKERTDKYKAISVEEKAALLAFIKSNPKTIIALDALQSYAGSMPDDVAAIENIYKGLAAPVQSSTAGKNFEKILTGWKNTAIGATAPEFTQNNTEGKPVKLVDFRGKYVLIDFWASWCGPCRAENPHVVKAYEKYKDKNFTILGVSLDQPTGKEAWIKAIADDNLTWTQVSDLKYWENEAARLYGIRGIPQNYLLDPKGKIIAKNLRGDALDKKLAEVIAN
ncbi:redoxin domain-containing protein [Chitinophaga sp. SYP-B3965]|uniref:TlpA disulfide reductase family protein n=1 Tax=Chitinophaga sp. SYP-B3965 TaxID=2663120 RepID=UPI001299E05C|nr:TlpA disulfide reductase family protein [Chitinophaga sp. SYP-B3965]MRG45226.1 redoxin domain-containing protein [Chitinophaga sp. SYP-B3965]